jgi:hypothetical protein
MTPRTIKPKIIKPVRAKAEPIVRARQLSALDAAAAVLRQAREPLNCVQIVERMLAQSLWRTTGKTPAATLSAAIQREIRAKGESSRFCKVRRGLFIAPA